MLESAVICERCSTAVELEITDSGEAATKITPASQYQEQQPTVESGPLGVPVWLWFVIGFVVLLFLAMLGI